MGTKFPFFNFLVCKIYFGMWARRARRAHRARRARGHVEHVGHLGPLGTPFSRLNLNEHGFQKQSFTNVL